MSYIFRPGQDLEEAIKFLVMAQDRANAAIAALQRSPLLTGRAFEKLALSGVGVPTTVYHGLGRAYKGFITTSLDADYPPYDATKESDDKTQIIKVEAYGATTASIWVF